MSAQLGLTRNRTEKFMGYRKAALRGGRRGSNNAAEQRVNAGARLLEAAIDNAGDGVTSIAVPPQWVDITSEVQEEIRQVQSKMNELKTIYGKTLLTTFDDHHPDEQTIEVLTADITRRFRKSQARLKSLNQIPGSADDVKVRTNVQRSLAMELSQLSQQFRKQQKAYLGKMKQNKEGGGFTADPFGGAAEGPGSKFNWEEGDEDPGMTTSQLQQIDNMESMVAERDQEIAKVMQSIQDLAQIMQDLSVMVIEQGTILDRIDYNMDLVAMKIDEGVKQIQKADKTQKSGCRILAIGVLFAACVLMMLILMVKSIFF